MTHHTHGDIRFDSIPLDESFFTPEGYFVDDVIVTRTGIFTYRPKNKPVRREARLPEHVFCPKSLETYKGKPIVITHAISADGLVNKETIKDVTVGTILRAYQDGDCVRCEIVIHDVEKK